METKFILHGGFDPNKKIQEDDLFFSEILKSAPNVVKILLVYFSKDFTKEPDKKISYEKDDILQFEKNKGEKELIFEVAEEQNFLEQIKKSDVIYLRGGNTSILLNNLNKFSTLTEEFNGKIIGADSAGVNSIAGYCYTHSSNAILKGMGIVPFKTICHYTEKFKDKAEELNKYDKNLELLILKENQYKVFNK